MIPAPEPRPRRIEVIERFQSMRLVLDGDEMEIDFFDIDAALRGCLRFCRPELTARFAGSC